MSDAPSLPQPPRRRSRKRRRGPHSHEDAAVAIHEAGHAVCAYLRGIAHGRLTVVATDEYRGCIEAPTRGASQARRLRMARRQPFLEIEFSLSGAVAELLWDDTIAWADAFTDKDRADAARIAGLVTNNSREADALVAYVRECVRTMLETPEAQLAINSLAISLLSRGTLGSRTVRQIIEAAGLRRRAFA